MLPPHQVSAVRPFPPPPYTLPFVKTPFFLHQGLFPFSLRLFVRSSLTKLPVIGHNHLFSLRTQMVRSPERLSSTPPLPSLYFFFKRTPFPPASPSFLGKGAYHFSLLPPYLASRPLDLWCGWPSSLNKTQRSLLCPSSDAVASVP